MERLPNNTHLNFCGKKVQELYKVDLIGQILGFREKIYNLKIFQNYNENNIQKRTAKLKKKLNKINRENQKNREELEKQRRKPLK